MSENSNSYIFDDDQPIIMPIAVLPGYVLFPGSLAMVDLTQQNEAHLTEALATGKLAFVTSMDSSLSGSIISESPEKTGTVVRVMSIGKSERDKNIKAARIKGLYRAELLRYFTRKGPNVKEDVFYAEVKKCKETNDLSEKESISYKLLIMNALAEYGKKVSPLYGGFLKVCIATEDIGNLCDFVAGNIKLLPDMAQEILEICDVRERADALVEVLRDSIEIKELEDEIEGKLQDRLEKHQREYQLREKMAIIAEELGDGDNMAAEAQKYRKAIEASGMPRECAEKLFTECDRLVKMSSVAADAAVIRGHLDACLALPWNISTKDKTSVSAAAKKLDKDHYGLEKVKQRILEQLCVYTLTGNTNAQILCLAGPPGVGKTSVARSVAEAMGRKFARISLGGVKDEAEIRGHRRTYIGSMPGRIIAAITQAGSNNPVILLDEVDKMGYDYKGDPSTALLEVLDPEQNSTFTDHFIDMPFDLSKVLFITTANDKNNITPPLLDRMEVIDIPGYTEEEKFQIAKRHLIKKQAAKHGLAAGCLRISDKALYAIIEGYTREAGVRALEQKIACLCRKAAVAVVENGEKRLSVTPEKLEELLGPVKYKNENISRKSEVGVANGLAWTAVGGEMLKIEVAAIGGSGKIQLTGSLGDVMKESAQAAITYIRSRADELGIEKDFYEKTDIHIHVPEGAVPKDGPSAGVTIATAIASELCKVPVRSNVAMTGEVTLRGKVLAIGGLREKTMAAYKNGMDVVIIPAANSSDIAELAPVVREHITFVTAEDMDTVLKNALDYPACKESKISVAASVPIDDRGFVGVGNEI